MTQISLRGTLLVAVSALALAACTSDSSNTDALNAANATIATKTSTIAERDATIASKNATIAEKEATITEKEATIVAKQASIDAANASIASLTTDKVNLLSTIVDRNEAIDGLEADIVDLQAEIAAANADITALEADVAGLEAIVDAGDADIVALQAEIAAAEAEIVALTADNAGLEGDLVAANASIAAKQATIDAANATIAAKQADLNVANATIATHLGTIAARDATIVANNADIATKASTISGLQANVAGLEAEVDGLEDQVALLTSEVASLETDKATLSAEKAALQSALDDLQTDYDDYVETAYNANMDANDYVPGTNPGENDGGYRQTVDTTANEVNTAKSDVENAQADYDEASGLVIDPAYVGVTLATYYADLADDAEIYAKYMGLDLTDANDLDALVDDSLYANEVTDLQTVLTNAETVFDQALLDYRADRAAVMGKNLTLYRADGRAIGASGAMVYKQNLSNDSLGLGAPLEEAARITALFLLNENGDPINVLVFDATAKDAFTLPVGAATFESDTMVAAFAQLEGPENTVNTYTLQSTGEAGSLSINFDDNTGSLVIVGINNGANQDFSVNATLTFNPVTGEFTADDVLQAYTSVASGNAEVAIGDLSGALSGNAEAFTAMLDATDTTNDGIEDLNVKIMTRIAGTGTTTLTAVAP